jgi:mannose-6-phosphate isomerase-like protein (cupin superfamily)
MRAQVHKADPSAEYYFREGCHILERWNTPGDPAVSMARARVPPGGRTRSHCLEGVTERYLIIAGEGRVRLGTRGPEPVGPGDVVLIPPGVAQSVENTGTGDLVFYAICSPRFTPDCYRDLEGRADP